MNVFIPITDEMLEQGRLPDELVAYQPGMCVMSQARSAQQPTQSKSSVNLSPGPTPSSEATPALSSSTYLAGFLLG